MNAKDTIVHADGCATNLGIIGAACNCGAEAQAEITWAIAFKEAKWQIGEALCSLVGNAMLEDWEKGKVLGDQLRPMFNWCKGIK